MDRFLKCVPVSMQFQAISVCSHIRSFDSHAKMFKNEFNVFFWNDGIVLYNIVCSCENAIIPQERRPALQAILHAHILVTNKHTKV